MITKFAPSALRLRRLATAAVFAFAGLVATSVDASDIDYETDTTVTFDGIDFGDNLLQVSVTGNVGKVIYVYEDGADLVVSIDWTPVYTISSAQVDVVVIAGTAGDDTILQMADKHTLIWARAGADYVTWNTMGTTIVWAGLGNDSLYGGSGQNRVYGEGGDDLISVSGGENYLFGDEGNDDIYGGTEGDYYIEGGEGEDRAILSELPPSYFPQTLSYAIDSDVETVTYN